MHKREIDRLKVSMDLGEHYSVEQEGFRMLMINGSRYTGEHDLEEEKK